MSCPEGKQEREEKNEKKDERLQHRGGGPGGQRYNEFYTGGRGERPPLLFVFVV